MQTTKIGLAAAACLMAIAAGARAAPPQLTPHPGLTAEFAVYGGYDSAGKLLGDYETYVRMTAVSGGGYSYAWRIAGPEPTAGVQTVSAQDNRTGAIMRTYYPNGDLSAPGYVGLLRLSDQTFADIKAGREARFVMDAGENPRTVRKVGEEDFTALVNEVPTSLHTIKVKGAGGGTFWVLDDPALPMVVKGELKWKWALVSIGEAGGSGAQVVGALKARGEATTHAILFAFNSATLEPEAKPVLDAVAAYVKGDPKVRLAIDGHTDSIGGAPFNLALSQKRADSVRAYLIAQGIDGRRLTAKGLGLTVPVADNSTPQGRARNRRVVFRAD